MIDDPVNFSCDLGIPMHEFRLVFGRTKINYDPSKEDINRMKHQYSLESAVWLLEKLLFPTGVTRPHLVSDSFVVVVNGKEEVRHTHMCVDDSGNVVFMVTTMRDDETVRIISLRTANISERAVFQSLTGYSKKTVYLQH